MQHVIACCGSNPDTPRTEGPRVGWDSQWAGITLARSYLPSHRNPHLLLPREKTEHPVCYLLTLKSLRLQPPFRTKSLRSSRAGLYFMMLHFIRKSASLNIFERSSLPARPRPDLGKQADPKDRHVTGNISTWSFSSRGEFSCLPSYSDFTLMTKKLKLLRP